jgi:hypothetical protein
MAVLVEALSVVVRKDAVARYLAGGEARFLELVPNRTLCVDDGLYRVGFLSPQETATFTGALQEAGLVFLNEQAVATDLAVVDQQHGPTTDCPWLGFGRTDIDGLGHEVSACWFRGTAACPQNLAAALQRHALVAPPGWRYENSLSAQFAYTPNGVPLR